MTTATAPKSWLAKLFGNLTREQAVALAKALLATGIALITKAILGLRPSMGSTIVQGVIFAIAVVMVFRVVQITPSLKGYKPGFIPLGIGAFLNWLVLLSNAGYMPSAVTTSPEGIYIPMAGSNLPYLGDWIFGFISPGDIILFMAFVGLVYTMLANRQKKVVKQISTI